MSHLMSVQRTPLSGVHQSHRGRQPAPDTGRDPAEFVNAQAASGKEKSRPDH